MPRTQYDGVGRNTYRQRRRQAPGYAIESVRHLKVDGLSGDLKTYHTLNNTEGSASKQGKPLFKTLLVHMPATTSRSGEFIVALLIASCLVCSVKSTVAGGSVTSNDMGIAVSLLDYDHVLLSKETDNSGSASDNSRIYAAEQQGSSELRNSRPISLDGFNLLWLIASKLEANDKLIRIEHDADDSSTTKPIHAASAADEIYLDSAWPRPYLRYGKKNVPISRVISTSLSSDNHPPPLAPGLSEYLDTALEHTRHAQAEKMLPEKPHTDIYEDNIVRINRFIAGNSIGFEMEFRVEQHSGSGYIITGRSLVGQPMFVPFATTKYANETSDKQSWFGLYSHTSATSYSLRLEYRNFAWHPKKQLQIRFSDNFRKSEWQKLAVNIDFNANTVNYWVNCSARPLVQLRANISHPSSFYSVYRLVQHRRRSTLPVKVTFRAALVTNGHTRMVPRQCENERMTVCTGGKIYMPCGPSCERTCEGIQNPDITDDYLRTCAIACLSGCHCRPGYVVHDGVCVKPDQCPCLIGDTAYAVGRNLTVNNEICTCIKGQWSCHRAPEFTQKPKNLTITAGRSGQISCAVAGNPQPAIVWEAPEGATYLTVTKDFGRLLILVLLNVTAKEAGIYRCRASLTTAGWEGSAIASVRIVSRPVITLPSTIPVTRGHPILAIDCSASGLPRPRIWWRRNGKAVQPNERLEVYRGTPGVVRLKIHNVQGTDAGEWSCLAYNVAGYSRSTVRVLVRLPEPNSMAFSRKPVDQYVKRGHTAMFNCEILNHPSTSLNVTWLKDGVRVDFTSKRVMTRGYRLVIKQIRDQDAGVYMCIVKVRRRGRELRAKAELMIKGRMLSWSDWSPCSGTCNGGIMFKRRTCTGIPPNDKTCHGKFTHIKRCNTQVCPGICSAVGDPHYTTFDGRRFNFHGDCGYVLSHDAIGYEFKVLLYNGECGMQLSCLNSVTVILSMPGLATVVGIQREGFVTVNSVRVALPYTSTGTPLVIDKIGLYIILNAGPDFELRWALPHRLYLIVGPKYFGRTQGFCGNYNADPTDDNILRSGRSVESDLEFGLDWAVLEGNIDRSCSAFEPLTQPCDRDELLRETAVDVCSHLQDKILFGPCHAKVSPLPFIEACKFDICRTSIKRRNVYFCTALSAYAEECLRNGLVLNWRTEDSCLETCFSGKVYEECGPRCVRYCPGIVNESGRICTSNERCVSGCHCPREMVLHKGRCIMVEQCPCVEGGIQYQNNSTRNRNCEKCVCQGGKWKCSFNKDLCEFPSSVIRGPISQVVPTGKSVSFCCEAAGIPKPIVEWYRDGRVIPPQTQEEPLDIAGTPIESDEPVQGYASTDLNIGNLTRGDAGSYYCKATNALGSQLSEVATLTVVEPWVSSCNPVPSRRTVNLPDGCEYAGENFLNVGYCPSLPCFYEEPSRGGYGVRRKKRCGGTKQCCRPSSLQPVSVSCNHADYAFSFYITTITQCSCAICESRYTIVEGSLLTAITEELLNHVKIDHQGRVVGYTSSTGSFSLRFYSLPEDSRYVALTFTDILHKRFPATVKNLPIVTGETTTHKVLINGRGSSVRFDASLGLRHMLRSTSNKGERLRLIIPPSSLILQQAQEPYVGQAQAVISIVEKDYELDRKRLHTIPGNFLGIDRRGNKQILLPSYIISVSLFSKYGRSLELLPEKSATFLVSTISFGKRMQPWVLDELTGLWRERDTKVQIEPHFNKRGEKILQLTAKIPRLNTAWALSDSEDACYVRVRALDKDNNTVAGVRVVMTSTDNVSPSAATSRRAHTDDSQMQALVESLTRTTDTNGVCMPIGCAKFGFISASKLASELSLLSPERPPAEMGRIIAQRSSEYGVISEILLTINTFDLNFLDDAGETSRRPSNALYFRSENECRITAPDKRTYTFRDQFQKEVTGFTQSSRAAASTSRTRLTPLPVATERRSHFGRRSKMYCHVKVSVSAPEHLSHFHRRNLGTLMILEAVTFSGRNNPDGMSILGWRRATFRTPVRQTPFSRYRRISPRSRSVRLRRVAKNVCVEYICGDDNPADMVYVTVKSAKDGYTRESTSLECQFIRSANGSRTGVQPRIRSRPVASKFSLGGYIMLPATVESTSRLRYTHRPLPEPAFPAKSLLESKSKCLAASGNQHISAWVGCS